MTQVRFWHQFADGEHKQEPKPTRSSPHDLHRSRQKQESSANAAMIRARNYRSSYACVVPDVGPAQDAKGGNSYL